MRSLLDHRGPDGHSTYLDDSVGLVHNRLSIIDLSENGTQPLFNEDGTLILICNGEIYNFLEIRKRLVGLGHQFSSHSDCEVILHLYEEKKGDIESTLNSLVGMFAFALYDKSVNKLILARDRMGIKPLYYSASNSFFSFASEVNPLVKSDLVSDQIDYSSLFEYFNLGYVPEPNTIYESIKSLSPGNYLQIDQHGVSKEWRYWDLPKKLNYNFKSVDEVTESIDDLLNRVVKDHLIADVSVGSFLSAGIDSSLISYYAANSHQNIPTFSAGFEGEPEDESIIAERTAGKINSEFHKFNLASDFFDGLDIHFKYLDQPFGISSALSLSRISNMAKSHVKVVLSGDGADELFAGYARHSHFPPTPYVNFLPLEVQKFFFKMGYKLTAKESLNQAFEELGRPSHFKYSDRLNLNYGPFQSSFLDASLEKKIDPFRYINRMGSIWNEYDNEDLINKMLFVDLKTSLVDEMLFKVDRMTMHQGIEGRVPFLDHRLVELAMEIPSKFKRSDLNGKLPLRKLVTKYLGADLGERGKTGFNAPLKKMISQDDKTNIRLGQEIEFLKSLDFMNSEKLIAFQTAIKKGDFNASQAFGLVSLANYFKKN